MTSAPLDKSPPRKAGKPIWPKVPAGLVRSVLAGHSALGLAFAALIYLVCFSGTVAVFAREFQRWEIPNAPILTAVQPAAIQTAMAEAVRRAGDGVEHVYIIPPTPDLPRLTVTTEAAGVEQVWLADGTGRLIGPGEPVWTEFMTRLHINLHLPQTWGMFVVGLTGVALLSSLVSGVMAHPRVFKDAFHLRWGGSKRLQEADLHNRLGVWALPFHVLVSLTGSLLGLTTIIVGVLALALFQGDVSKAYDLFLPPHPIDDPRPAAALPNVAAALEATRRLSPGSTPTFIGLEHPTERGQGILISVTQPNALAGGGNFTFDGQGAPIDASTAQTATLGETILGALGPLHFGWFGGLGVKIAYGLLGLALTSVTASGVSIWLARRRDKGRPAPRWERIWIATVWSQPVAFLVSAATTLAWSGETPVIPLAAWAMATGLSLSAAVLAQPRLLSKAFRASTAVLLVATALVHVGVHGAVLADPAAWWVDVVLVGLAIAVMATVWTPRPFRKVGPSAQFV